MAFICVVTLISTIPMYMGWLRLGKSPGSTNDADFWLGISNSSMQLLNLLTMIVPATQNSWMPFQSWIWTWAATVTSFSCSILAPVLYSMVFTGWSAAIAFTGNVAQAFLTLQLMQAVCRATRVVGAQEQKRLAASF